MIRKFDYPIGTRVIIEIVESDLSCDECCFFGTCDAECDDMCMESNRYDRTNIIYKLVGCENDKDDKNTIEKLEKENEQLKAQVEKMRQDVSTTESTGGGRMTDKLSLSDIHEYAHKLFKSFNNLNFKSNYNYALQAFYLEEKLYVVRSKILDDYQYTLVEADSEEQAIKKCFIYYDPNYEFKVASLH